MTTSLKIFLYASHFFLAISALYVCVRSCYFYFIKDARNQSRNVVLMCINLFICVLCGWWNTTLGLNMVVNLIRSISFYNIFLTFTLLMVNDVCLLENKNKAVRYSIISEALWIMLLEFCLKCSYDLPKELILNTQSISERVCFQHFVYSSVWPQVLAKSVVSLGIIMPVLLTDTSNKRVFVGAFIMIVCSLLDSFSEIYSIHVIDGIVTNGTFVFNMMFNFIDVVLYYLELIGLLYVAYSSMRSMSRQTKHEEVQATIYSMLVDFDSTSSMYKSNCFKAGQISRNIPDADIKKLLKKSGIDNLGVFYFNRGREGKSFDKY